MKDCLISLICISLMTTEDVMTVLLDAMVVCSLETYVVLTPLHRLRVTSVALFLSIICYRLAIWLENPMIAFPDLRHMKECALRYKNIEDRLEKGHARFNKLEYMIWGLYGASSIYRNR